jgi:regulatory protein
MSGECTILKLTAEKKNPERIQIFTDQGACCSLSLDDVVRFGLVCGMPVSVALMESLQEKQGENDLYNRALSYILRSPRAEAEIRRYLAKCLATPKMRKNADGRATQELIERVIARLRTANYINDESYARMFALSKHVKNSARLVRAKLRARGVSAELVQAATGELSDSDLIETTAQKYMRTKEPTSQNFQRLFRYLLGKGFDYDQVSGAVSQIRREVKNVSGS